MTTTITGIAVQLTADEESQLVAQGWTAPVSTPVPTPTPDPAPTQIVIQRTGTAYATFALAHAAAQDGDTILVPPQTFNVSPDGFSIYKGITVQSAVPGQRYKIVVAPNSAGAIGSGVSVPTTYRTNAGLSGRFAVVVQDAEICATQLTNVTGKAAVYIDSRSDGPPVDFTLRNCYLHDYDQGVETSNEYDPANRTSTLTIDGCDIEQTGDIASGDNNHCLYIGMIASLTITNTKVINQKNPAWTGPTLDSSGNVTGPNYWPVGMVVKTRAKATTITGCTLTGSANSNLVECGNGGDLLIDNCRLEQGQWTDGNALVSYGRFFGVNEPTDATKQVALDGRTNRLRVTNCTFVNDNTTKPMQWIELSERCTQAGWTAAGWTGAPPTLTYQIGGNTFTDSSAGRAIDPTKGYPGLTPAQVLGIPLTIDGSIVTVGAAATPPLPGITPPAWYAKTILNGWSVLPFPSIASQNQTAAADRANPDDIGGTYKAIYPMSGSAAGYVTSGAVWPNVDTNTPPTPAPVIAGVPAIPGYGDYRGDQGAVLASNATVKRRGKTYSGTFMVWPAGGGHGVGINNQILAYHLESGVFLDLTQPSMPPMGVADATFNPNFMSWHGGPKGATAVGPGADGRPLSTHQYNTVVYDKKRNRIVWTAGPAQVTGPKSITYAFQLDADAWDGTNDAVAFPARFADYLSTAGGAIGNGRNSVQCIDSSRDEIWNSYPNSQYVNTVAIAHASAAPGSQWRYVELTPGNGNAPLGAADVVAWALEGEPWLVFMDELNPARGATILHRDYVAGNSGAGAQNPALWEQVKRKYWNVTFTPKNGDPANAIPVKVLDANYIPNVDSDATHGIPATVTFDPVDRVFYAIVFQLDANVLMDVYKVTPPALDTSGATGAGSTFVTGIGGTEVVVPWVTEKLAKDPASTLQVPSLGNTAPAGKFPFYPSHKTASVVHASWGKGIFFMHDASKSPIFWRLA